MIFDPELAAAAKRHARAQAKARQKAAEAAAAAAAAPAPAEKPVTSSSATSVPSETVTDAARNTRANSRADSSATSLAPPQAKHDAAARSVDHEGSPTEKVVADAGRTGKSGLGNSSTGPIPGGADGSGSADSGSGNGSGLVSRTSSGGDSEGASRAGPVVLRSRMMKPRVLLKIVVLGSSNVSFSSPVPVLVYLLVYPLELKQPYRAGDEMQVRST